MKNNITNYINKNIIKKINPIYFFSIIIIFFVTIAYNSNRYYEHLPTIPLYPNNYEEVKEVEDYINKKDSKMDALIKLTDESCVYAFKNHVNEDLNTLDNISSEISNYIFFFKYLFNRERPFDTNPNLNKYPSTSAYSPSFPSGHAMQAQYLAKVLSKKYPEKKELLYDLGNKCGMARVYAGLHFPSDVKFGQFLVNILP
jgi:hypothetical protein